MKKVTRIIGAVCMMALLTFVSTSCKKDQENSEVTISVTVPNIETVNADRAYINEDGFFMWDNNDFIRVYNLADEDNAILSKTSVYSKIGSGTSATARFRGPSLGVRQNQGYRIFYPYTMVKGTDEEINTELWNANHQTFVVATEQQYCSYPTVSGHYYSMVDPAAMPMAQYMNKLTDAATLEHLFGVASIGLKAQTGKTVVVDSVVIMDKHFNLTGEVSLKLHKAMVNPAQPGYDAQYDLNNAWNEFYNTYQQIDTPYVVNVLKPLYDYMDYDVDYNTTGNRIRMNCIYEHEDGTRGGVVLQTGENKTYFNFMLRPLALHTGFDVLVYVHGKTEPVFLTTDAHPQPAGADRGDFVCGSTTVPNYTWAVQPGTRKYYTRSYAIE